MTNKFIQEFNREPNTDELKDYINQKYPKIKIKDLIRKNAGIA